MSYSQSGQDEYVLKLIGKDGYFLDIGSGDGWQPSYSPDGGSNTLLLEENGWNGLLIDNNPSLKEQADRRRNPFVLADATSLNYLQLLKEHNAPKIIDYISFDVDDATPSAFEQLMQYEISFKIMTFEHDLYRVGDEIKKQAKKLLTEKGYIIIHENHMHDGSNPYEDWYINPEHINSHLHTEWSCSHCEAR